MPSTRPTVDPVLDILEEMGYDFDELEGDGYKRSIKEAMIKNHPDKGGDSEKFIILNQEWQKLRRGGSRPTGVKEKRTTIKGDKLMGKDAKKGASSPITDKSKLLPGKGKFSADDIPKEEGEDEGEGDGGSKVDDIIKFLNGEVKQKLDEINTSVVEIKDVLDTQNQLAEDRDEDMRQALLDARKSKREGKLEGDGKEKGLKEKLLGQVTKPVEGFLGKLIKFVTMTFVGSVVNRIMGILKDPGQLLDPIKNFFNALIGLVNLVIKGLWMITGAPINLLINGINKGTQSLLKTFNKATGLLKIPPIELPEIPYIPRPPDIPTIPLSKTAQEKNEGVAMAGGGLVPGDTGESGMDGEDGIAGAPGEIGADAIGAPGLDGASGLDGLDGVSDIPIPEGKSTDNKLGQINATKMSGGGFVPYSEFTLGTGHNVINTAPGNIMGYNKGGKVPGSGSGDTVPAMLTPGEFVMSKGAVDKIGVDNLMAMNKDGGGTNQPKMMKFAGGGVVPPTIDPPSKKSKVIVVGGGGSKPPGRVSSSGDSGSGAPKFSSTDNNNITVAVIKSIYNIMS